MLPFTRTRTSIVALLFAAGLSTSPARADGIADFYKGKTVSLTVGSSTGGGYDTMARAVARFIGKHMPGNPTVVVRNMPGAGVLDCCRLRRRWRP